MESKSNIIINLAKFGIFADRVELWGSGGPMREFLWSEDMADASVYALENISFNDTYKTMDK